MESLFKYQKEGVTWLAGKRHALLADEMGLGKSAQAIAAADRIGAAPILVLCPAVARINWTREFARFSTRNLRSLAVLTTRDAPQISSADVTACSYDLALRPDVHSRLCARRWSVLILDEAHFLKEPGAARTKAVLGSGGLAHHADRVWLLTGTPAPNHPGELWVPLYTFGVTALTYEDFLERFTTRREVKVGANRYVKRVTGGRNIPGLRRLMESKDFVMRRRKIDVLKDLPPIRYSDVVVEPSPVPDEIWRYHFQNYLLYPEVFHKDIAKGETVIEAVTSTLGMGEDSMRILEGLNNRDEIKSVRRWTGLKKVPAVVEIVKGELDANAYPKIVLFAVHKCVIEELEMALKDYGAVKIYGGTPAHKRDRVLQRFQRDPRCRVFIGQTVAAGTAVTLTAASEVGVVEADWTPGNNQQAVMRVHRIGQPRPVNVRFFSTPGYDERVSRVLKNKTRVLTELFDPPKESVAFVDPFSD